MSITKLEQLEKDLLSSYSQTMDLIRSFDSQQLNQPMATGKWSPAQTMAHVNLATSLSSSYFLKKMNGQKELKKAGLASKIKGRLLISALKSDKKYKAPDAAAQVPEHVSIEALEEENSKIVASITALRENWSAEIMDKLVYTHPIAGPISLTAFYRFLIEHIGHHFRQMEQFKVKSVS